MISSSRRRACRSRSGSCENSASSQLSDNWSIRRPASGLQANPGPTTRHPRSTRPPATSSAPSQRADDGVICQDIPDRCVASFSCPATDRTRPSNADPSPELESRRDPTSPRVTATPALTQSHQPVATGGHDPMGTSPRTRRRETTDDGARPRTHTPNRPGPDATGRLPRPTTRRS